MTTAVSPWFLRGYLVGRLRGVKIYVRGTALALWGTLALGSLLYGMPLVVTGLCLAALLTIHEMGHASVARHFGYEVFKVEIGALHGKCHIETPTSEYEHSLIAWGGVAAQFPVFLLTTTILVVFGNTTIGSANVALVVGSYANLVIMAFQLIPVAPYDGQKAWRLLPLQVEAWRWKRELRKKRPW